MDSKATKILTIAVIVIVIAAALTVFFVMNNKDDKGKTSLGSGRLLVYCLSMELSTRSPITLSV